MADVRQLETGLAAVEISGQSFFSKGPFKYYVIRRMGGLGRPNDYFIA